MNDSVSEFRMGSYARALRYFALVDAARQAEAGSSADPSIAQLVVALATKLEDIERRLDAAMPGDQSDQPT